MDYANDGERFGIVFDVPCDDKNQNSVDVSTSINRSNFLLNGHRSGGKDSDYRPYPNRGPETGFCGVLRSFDVFNIPPVGLLFVAGDSTLSQMSL